MAKEKEIQELEIRISTTGEKEAEAKMSRLEKRKAKWEKEFRQMRSGKTSRETRAMKAYEDRIKSGSTSSSAARISENITSKLNVTSKKTNKTIKDRIALERQLYKEMFSNNKKAAKSQHEAGRRSGGGFIGKAMLYMGFAMLSQYMVSAGLQGAMALGDVTANMEGDVLKGGAARESYGKRSNVEDFDRAVNLYSALTGQNKYASRSRLGEISGSLEAAGVNLSGDQLSGVARGIKGLSGGMGITEEMASQKMLGLLSGRISAQEAGLVGVKRSDDPNKTLESILSFLEKNAVTAAVMREDTMSSIMTRIRSAPGGMISSLYDQAPDQIKSGFRVIADWIDVFFGKGDNEVVTYWGRTWAQFEQMSTKVFGDGAKEASKNISIAVSAAIKGIELAAIGAKSTYDVITMSKELVKTKLDTQAIKMGGDPTTDAILVDMLDEKLDSLFFSIPTVKAFPELWNTAKKELGSNPTPLSGGGMQGGNIIIQANNVTIDKDNNIKNDEIFNQGGF